jgi:hypothetical protein
MIYVVVSSNIFGNKKFHVANWGSSRITTKGDAENLLKKVLPKYPDAEIMKFKNMGDAEVSIGAYNTKLNKNV